MNKEEYLRRKRDFPEPILEAAMNNYIINQVIDQYCVGGIITKEEALSKMVLLLATDWNQKTNELVRFYMINSTFLAKRK